MPDLGQIWQEHQSEILAILAGALAALALLALIRKAITWCIILLVLAAIAISWWLAHEQDLLGGAEGVLDLLR